jgi:hypothetical protein
MDYLASYHCITVCSFYLLLKSLLRGSSCWLIYYFVSSTAMVNRWCGVSVLKNLLLFCWACSGEKLWIILHLATVLPCVVSIYS